MFNDVHIFKNITVIMYYVWNNMEIKESSEYSKNQIIEFLWRKSGMEYLS